MRPRHLVCITLAAACHALLCAQAPPVLTKAAPAAASVQPRGSTGAPEPAASANLPDDPGQELLPQAVPEPQAPSGAPIEWTAAHQEWAGDTITLSGQVVAHTRGYTIEADHVTYNRVTTVLHADGHLKVTGGPNDVSLTATHGDMRLDTHTARFYNVTGTQGVRALGRTPVYTTTTPLLFSGRVLLETGEGHYRIIDGSITNCRLPHPDWRIAAHSIGLDDQNASTSNALFQFLGMPLFYIPYLKHRTDETGRVSGWLIPQATISSIEGYVLGDQYYWAIDRSMDMLIGLEYYSKRGWAPNGDFRYRGMGLDRLTVRWNALFDRGVEEAVTNPATGQTTTQLANQGGVDISVEGRRDFSANTRLAGTAEYLSSYVYRLVFDDIYTQATSSQVSSEIVLTHNRNGILPSIWTDRFQSFASINNGDEVKILRLPMLRYDVLDRPLFRSPFYWGMGSSLGYLNRSEPDFHSRNVGRMDFYPHLSLPVAAAGWSFLPEVALRDTAYSISQNPRLTNPDLPPHISHEPLNRSDLEAAIDIRPPALERDYELTRWHRQLRHVIEPELNYRFVGGIGKSARNVLLYDTTDTATDVNEGGFSLTQRFYLRQTGLKPCAAQAPKTEDADAPQADSSTAAASGGLCPSAPREWASWEIAQEYFLDPKFGGALIPGRRNVFDATLDLMAPTFLTSPRNVAPIVSRIRFEAIDNLRIQWDLAYDTIAGEMAADNLYAGYQIGRTTFGLSHALLNAVDDMVPDLATTAWPASLPVVAPSTLKSQMITPFLEIGKQSGAGFNLAVNGGYDFVQHMVQYAGVQTVYNWDCCGLTLGYRRYILGVSGAASRDETQWLGSFTLANFGAVGNIRRANSVFHDPTQPPVY